MGGSLSGRLVERVVLDRLTDPRHSGPVAIQHFDVTGENLAGDRGRLMFGYSTQGADKSANAISVAEIDAQQGREHECDAVAERVTDLDGFGHGSVAQSSGLVLHAHEPQRVGESAETHDTRVMAETQHMLRSVDVAEVGDNPLETG